MTYQNRDGVQCEITKENPGFTRNMFIPEGTPYFVQCQNGESFCISEARLKAEFTGVKKMKKDSSDL